MKTHLLTAFALLAALSVGAKSLTPDQALERISPYLPASQAPTRAGAWQLAYTAFMPDGESAGCYLFKSDNGFVIASADDRAIPLLGYSDDPEFDESTMSPEFKYWLDEYGRQMAFAKDVPDIQPEEGVDSPKTPIAPLCKTRWNQFAPYYDVCSEAYGRPVVTGCVATALSQIMKYHNWPAQGTGQSSYIWDGKTFSFDYGATAFEWDNMTDSYDRHSTAAQNHAVAVLMYATGVAVHMEYEPGGSGASPERIPYALGAYFGYEDEALYIQRDFYTLTDWEELIYEQLQYVGPVQYSGYVARGGGHSFVCDGYDKDGYFHINWGWGGGNDGYYRLTALRAEHSGWGDAIAQGGFNFNQDIVAYITPPGKAQISAPKVLLNNSGNFHIAQNWAYAGRDITARGAYWNSGNKAIDGRFGIQAVSEAGDTIYFPGWELDEYRGGEGWGSFWANIPNDIATGTYTLYPAFEVDGQWYLFRTAVGAQSSERMTVSNVDGKRKCVFESVDQHPDISAIDVIAPQEIETKKGFTIHATVQNTGNVEWNGELSAAIYNMKGQMIAYGIGMSLDLQPNTEQVTYYNCRLDHIVDQSLLTDGPVELYLINMGDKKPISQGIKVNLTGEAISGVELPSLATENLNADTKVYNTNGCLVGIGDKALSNLRGGLYIIVAPNGKTRKIMVK